MEIDKADYDTTQTSRESIENRIPYKARNLDKLRHVWNEDEIKYRKEITKKKKFNPNIISRFPIW